jgi:hypothetical protein
MKKIIFIYLFLALCSPANAESTQDLNKCASVMQLGAMTTKMSVNSAPPYAREKYQRKYEFFMQGFINLKKNAKRNPDYVSDKSFEDKSVEGSTNMLSSMRDGSLSAATFNELTKNCIFMSGLNLSDLPQ